MPVPLIVNVLRIDGFQTVEESLKVAFHGTTTVAPTLAPEAYPVRCFETLGHLGNPVLA